MFPVGWFEKGKTLALALDLDAGTMLTSVDGGAWVVTFPGGCKPSATVGAGLFPALCGKGGARVRCNWGGDAERPMRHGPPSGDYRVMGLAMEAGAGAAMQVQHSPHPPST